MKDVGGKKIFTIFVCIVYFKVYYDI